MRYEQFPISFRLFSSWSLFMIESNFACPWWIKARPNGGMKELHQTRSGTDKHGGTETDRHGGRLLPDRPAIKWRDGQAGWSGWQAARRGCKWTARKGRATFRRIDSRAVRQTDRRRDTWIDGPVDSEWFRCASQPSLAVHKGPGQVAWGVSPKPLMTSREGLMEGFKRWQKSF